MNEQDILHEQAMVLFDRAYRHHRNGELGDAIELYRRSIAMHPTAEAHTYLGWAYSVFGRYDEAIAECHKAIQLNPNWGNPYNDIGAYLIEMERWEEAVPWLEKAIHVTQYDLTHYAYMNLGRVYEYRGDGRTALACYRAALELSPLYLAAERAKNRLLGRLS
ncbi:MAG: tetratricopeptide repeat protein [Chloroflexi bacterium]|nr:tetratricopeptide repeat protein [Chloroflexota bacterium]